MGENRSKEVKNCIKNWNECVFDVFSLPRKRIFATSRQLRKHILLTFFQPSISAEMTKGKNRTKGRLEYYYEAIAELSRCKRIDIRW